ncbi:DUF6415 family natural product biosynthesis protein [Streptomyces sp. CB03238]|uniref:DUF6415 family natural product biosynthesis protein n=1 Tax=Streptomyces sp. CB03238 TaxID=1907777 RepID=UPI000A104468|nr:DUF6415 family natural product biosynthesis protein [Streptomyces sp. CB03238]ORT60078.1 hypothetical protein BKD26_10805 [Streptomyces sp. CB03238]
MDPKPLDLATMRDTARYVLTLESALLPLGELDVLIDTLHGHVRLLVPEVRALIRSMPVGDVPARVARIGIEEAWRRLYTPPGPGWDATFRHAKKVALSVNSLCDHYETLDPALR